MKSKIDWDGLIEKWENVVGKRLCNLPVDLTIQALQTAKANELAFDVNAHLFNGGKICIEGTANKFYTLDKTIDILEGYGSGSHVNFIDLLFTYAGTGKIKPYEEPLEMPKDGVWYWVKNVNGAVIPSQFLGNSNCFMDAKYSDLLRDDQGKPRVCTGLGD